MRYAFAKERERSEEMAYRFYITDALMAIAENTQKIRGGRAMKRRFADVLEPKKEQPKVSGQVIAKDLIARLGRQ